MIPAAVEVALVAMQANALLVGGGFLSAFIALRALLHMRQTVKRIDLEGKLGRPRFLRIW